VREELSPLNELHEEVQLLVVLRLAFLLHAEGVRNVGHDENFVLHVFHLGALHKFVFLERFARGLGAILSLRESH